ncbi:MAG: biopolymer transporter ExbD [Desulfobacteraceae bacterium]|nr:MAG: biopolymer transporter ExbD [Desulfobacteraceae bacterium]
MKIRVPRRKRVRIEMIPLMDLLFLLLVFFMYAMLSMAVHRGLPVRLPSSDAAEPDTASTLAITVKEDGTVFVDREPVALRDLTAVLAASAGRAGAPNPGILLFADRNLPYQDLFAVLDRIRAAGLSRISLQAEAEPPP